MGQLIEISMVSILPDQSVLFSADMHVGLYMFILMK